jgi:hypothetical protein
VGAIVDLDARLAVIIGRRPDGSTVQETVNLAPIQMGHLGYVEVQYKDGSPSPHLVPRCFANATAHSTWQIVCWAGGSIGVTAMLVWLFIAWRRKRPASSAKVA